jgi:hypothetical protein
MNRSMRHSVSRPLRWVAAACALSIWLLGVFATSSHLHSALHADAGETGHTCAITLFKDGVENATVFTAIVVTPVVFPVGETVQVTEIPGQNSVGLLPPGRGPPLS